MPSIPRLVVRDDPDSSTLTPTMITLLIVLLCLTLAGIASVAVLFALRLVRARRAAAEYQDLPTHNHSLAVGRKHGHRRTLTITTNTPYRPSSSSPSSAFLNEKAAFFSSPTAGSPPGSAVPEIHITFPDDGTHSGFNKRNSGHVVIVKINDNGGVGLAPYREEEDEKRDGEYLPAYQGREGEWNSLDLDSMGGLKENNTRGGDKQWA